MRFLCCVMWCVLVAVTGASALTLTWDAVTTDINDQPLTIAGYTVYYSTTVSGPWTPVTTTTDTSVTVPTQRGYYTVTAVSLLQEESDYAVPVSTERPRKPVITRVTR